jgi:hypothetical protein
VEACRTLNTILMYISRTKQYHSRSVSPRLLVHCLTEQLGPWFCNHLSGARPAGVRRSNIYDQILKKNEQIYALIAICLSICPASVKHLDEAVQQVRGLSSPSHADRLTLTRVGSLTPFTDSIAAGAA